MTLCEIEFDGASKGNPGKGGAGAIVKIHNPYKQSMRTWRLRQGLGITTNNIAEYKGLILGMRFALRKGCQEITVKGDSQLVCYQVEDRYQTRNPNLIPLYEEVRRLRNQFESFTISHVRRELNAEADSQADQATNLPNGKIEEELDPTTYYHHIPQYL